MTITPATVSYMKGNTMTHTGFHQHRTGMWEWTADTCDCDYCKSWVDSTITECVYDRALQGSCVVTHDGIVNTITVESWSGRVA